MPVEEIIRAVLKALAKDALSEAATALQTELEIDYLVLLQVGEQRVVVSQCGTAFIRSPREAEGLRGDAEGFHHLVFQVLPCGTVIFEVVSSALGQR